MSTFSLFNDKQFWIIALIIGSIYGMIDTFADHEVVYAILVLCVTGLSELNLRVKIGYMLIIIFSIPIILNFQTIYLLLPALQIILILIFKRFELDQSEEDYIMSQSWDNIQDVLFVKDINLKYVLINKELENFYNLKREDMLGKTDLDLFEKERANYFRSGDLEIIETKQPRVFVEDSTSMGKIRRVMTIKYPIKDDRGNVKWVFGISRDITDLEEERKEFVEGKIILESVFNFAPNPIFVKDLSLSYIKVNQEFANYYGYTADEIIGKSDYDILDKQTADKLRKIDRIVIETGKMQYIQSELIIGGSKIFVITTKGPLYNKEEEIIGIVGISIDITDIKNIESKIIETEKMDSIGNLAGGIAHDLNNMLTSVLGYASLLSYQDAQNQEFVNNVITASNQASELIKKLLIFTQKQSNDLKPINLNSVIKDTYILLKPSIPKDINVTLSLQDELPFIDGDLIQVTQIILNIFLNAIEEVGLIGNIEISTALTEVTSFDMFNVVSKDASQGAFIKISIADSGSGIDPEIVKRIFEPFFTTKNQGSTSGTGLGLSIVYGVINTHKGAINVTSEKGKGTTFEILLPVGKIKDTVDLNYNAMPLMIPGKVLIIDDNENVKEVFKAISERLDFEVQTASDGVEGILVFSKENNISAIVLDLIMPKMNGMDTYIEIRKLNESIPIIVSTGFGEEKDAQKLRALGARYFLPKPYSLEKVNMVMHKIFSKNA